jgi:hypothetical protein
MDPYNNLNDFIDLVYSNNYGKTKLMANLMECMVSRAHTHNYTLPDYPNPLEPKQAGRSKAPCQKKEEDMNSYANVTAAMNISDTTEKDQRRHLQNRLYDIASSKKYALKKQFGLTNDDTPNTFEELLARIQGGKYVIDEKNAKRRDYNGGLGYVTWRDPAVKEDQAGYDAAKKELDAAQQKVSDDIAILPPADGLASLRAFEEAK